MFKLISSLGLLFSAGLLQVKPTPLASPVIRQEAPPSADADNRLAFFVIGDWGQGDTNQRNVAEAMAAEASDNPIDFIISVGDNFYPKGVKSLKDPHWTNSFENMYSDTSLQRDWYTAFGNHDYMSWLKPQLNYHTINPRWKAEERYYSFSKPIPGSSDSALFVVIDTNPFDGTLRLPRHKGLWRQNKKKQLKWLDQTLAQSNAKWKIVVGHHPLFTTGYRRGKMLDVRAAFLPLFEKHGVDAYFAGHDHDLQHQQPAGHTHYFVSGAGSEFRGVTQDSTMTKFAASDYGFMRAEVTPDKLVVTVINHQNKPLYQTEILN